MSLLKITDLHKHYTIKKQNQSAIGMIRDIISKGKLDHSFLHALDGVGFEINENESIGLVGESGCGKSTLVKAICRLIDVSSGSIILDGTDIGSITPNKFVHTKQRAQIQVVFQDSHESLNPRYTAYQCIADPLKNILNIRDKSELDRRIFSLAEKVSFPHDLLHRLPHQLSGGQKARINIARAIAVSPKLLILDEPTSALDVSIQALILKLLVKLRKELNISYLFVSHDLNVVRMLCDRIVVMYMGKVVESGSAEDVFYDPQHPYTKALISSIPSTASKNTSDRIILNGEISSPIDPDPLVCRFFGRCPNGEDKCQQDQPLLKQISDQHYVACHYR